ncbi:hypothetical protein BGZ63DRAFT_395506 [Mariannaea sp. PMI_226]|nr:hypothetical protein BGZ63DRAFT_395506 [Mariannaea sp. PMI_226]
MANRTVPQNYDGVANGDIPIQRLAELESHMRRLVEDPNEPIDAELFFHIELQLTDSNVFTLLENLLPSLRLILDTTNQDPTPLLSLATRLMAPLSLSHCLNIVDWDSIVVALKSPVPGAVLLALGIVQKATRDIEDIRLLSNHPEVLDEILQVWLANPDVGASSQANNVLDELLTADCPNLPENAPPVNGHFLGIAHEMPKSRFYGDGVIWRYMFQQRRGLSIISALCKPEIPTRVTGYAQSRLLRILPRLVHLNYRAVCEIPFPDLLTMPEPLRARVGTGLLQWAALNMVDMTDVILPYILTGFFEAFVSIMRISNRVHEKDELVRTFMKAATEQYAWLEQTLRTLPDRTIEEEAEPLSIYINQLLN